MRRGVRRLPAVILACVAAGFAMSAVAQTPEEARETLAFYGQEAAIVTRLQALEDAHKPCDCVFRHVTVVDVAQGQLASNMRVEIGAGRIRSIERESDASGEHDGDLVEIDGRGRFLAPGLADMHVHQLLSADAHLLHLANGVTTVRDLDGYDWMLEWRAQSQRNEWIGPDMIVTGTILASYPMGMYAIVVESPEEARALVRKQTADGYDYIKVHNRLTLPVYDAVMDEARRNGIGVVGHVPHDISVARALSLGQETIEHLKGYIDDRTLRISRDDWLTPTRWSTVWNTPTLYTNRQYLRGEAARAFFASEEAQYVPIGFREAWRTTMDAPLRPVFAEELDQRHEVMRRLLGVTNRFLAGSDSGGGSPYMVSGFALHTELEMLQAAGLDTLEALRSATVYAARATGHEQSFGEVAVGLQANLLLLDANPLESTAHLRRPAGVMLRGRWFSREVLARELDWLAERYGSPPPAVDPEELVERIRRLDADGYVFPAHQLNELADALVALDRPALADTVAALGARQPLIPAIDRAPTRQAYFERLLVPVESSLSF